MRLSDQTVSTIREAVKKYFDEETKVFLFGSRVDDSKKGGDIDLYIETDVKEDIFKRKLKMISYLCEKLGEQKIDIVIKSSGAERDIDKIAKLEGVLL